MKDILSSNPFRQPEELWILSLRTKYKYVIAIEDFFEEKTLAVSSHEISSKTVDSMPDDEWEVEIYFPLEPKDDIIPQDLQNFIETDSIKITKIENKDWTEASLASLGEIKTEKFHIIRSSESTVQPELIPIILNLSRAFGTGEHATTMGCLEALERSVDMNPKRVLDIGTGTGILAIAAKKLWPEAQVIATDIDPIAIEVAQHHAHENGVELEFIVADGTSQIENKYDIILANILARPLIEMARDISSLIADKGIVILSGFLDNQKQEILFTYQKYNLSLVTCLEKNQWIILVFIK